MSGYLLDTNIISKFAPGKPQPDQRFVQWMREKGAFRYLPLLRHAGPRSGIQLASVCEPDDSFVLVPKNLSPRRRAVAGPRIKSGVTG